MQKQKKLSTVLYNDERHVLVIVLAIFYTSFNIKSSHKIIIIICVLVTARIWKISSSSTNLRTPRKIGRNGRSSKSLMPIIASHASTQIIN
jgi:hypothetical protein